MEECHLKKELDFSGLEALNISMKFEEDSAMVDMLLREKQEVKILGFIDVAFFNTCRIEDLVKLNFEDLKIVSRGVYVLERQVFDAITNFLIKGDLFSEKELTPYLVFTGKEYHFLLASEWKVVGGRNAMDLPSTYFIDSINLKMNDNQRTNSDSY